jgi:hypothetical protein
MPKARKPVYHINDVLDSQNKVFVKYPERASLALSVVPMRCPSLPGQTKNGSRVVGRLENLSEDERLVTLPWSWAHKHPIDNFDDPLGPFRPYNEPIYKIATGEKPCDLVHCLPHPDTVIDNLTYDFPCGCPPKHLACIQLQPPQHLLGCQTSYKTGSLNWPNTKGFPSGKKAAVWDINETFYFLVPPRVSSTPSSGTKRKRRNGGRRTGLTDKKGYRYGDRAGLQ